MKWTAIALAALAFAAAGCESPIVGASCRPGFTVCADGCVDLQADFRNCGECDNNCGRFVCEQGMCSTRLREDAGMDGGADGDAGTFNPDTGVPDSCRLGSLSCNGVCVDVRYDSQRCGACDLACAKGQFCTSGRCRNDCTGDLKFCGGECRDLSSDPENCGTCGNVCASGVCIDGQCDDPLTGQVVVIGHDLTTANNAMRRLAANATSLAPRAQVRMLVYRGEATDASVRGLMDALDLSRRETGRDYALTDAVEALVPAQLENADVFVIHSQADASNSTLRKLGRQWANALAQFVILGRTVVLFEAPSASNGGTYQILEPAHIFSAGSREEIPNQQLRVQTPGNGVVLRSPSRYLSTSHSVHFTDIDSQAVTLVVDEDGEPVIVERFFILPK